MVQRLHYHIVMNFFTVKTNWGHCTTQPRYVHHKYAKTLFTLFKFKMFMEIDCIRCCSYTIIYECSLSRYSAFLLSILLFVSSWSVFPFFFLIVDLILPKERVDSIIQQFFCIDSIIEFSHIINFIIHH